MNIKDIYHGVESKLEDFDYRYDSTDVEEFVASVLDMYLDTAERGFGRASVDLIGAHDLFIALMESKYNKGLTRIHVERIVNFILGELIDYLRTFKVVRVYDYTIFGTQLAMDCLCKMKVRAVA